MLIKSSDQKTCHFFSHLLPIYIVCKSQRINTLANTFYQQQMALACRFCHPDPMLTEKASYTSVLSYGDITGVYQEVLRIEAMAMIVPGHCVRCEVCERYSMISYALACYIHGAHAEKDKSAHYAKLCRSFKMVTHTASI